MKFSPIFPTTLHLRTHSQWLCLWTGLPEDTKGLPNSHCILADEAHGWDIPEQQWEVCGSPLSREHLHVRLWWWVLTWNVWTDVPTDSLCSTVSSDSVLAWCYRKKSHEIWLNGLTIDLSPHLKTSVFINSVSRNCITRVSSAESSVQHEPPSCRRITGISKDIWSVLEKDAWDDASFFTNYDII